MLKFSQFVAESRARNAKQKSTNIRRPQPRSPARPQPLELIVINATPSLSVRIRQLLGLKRR